MLLDNEKTEISKLWKQLKEYRIANSVKQEIYEGKNRLKDLGISIPPQLKNVQESVGWAKIAVNALNDRLMFEGWNDPAGVGLDEMFSENDLLSRSKQAHLDKFKFGIGYVMIALGDTSIGEPEILITPENPNNMVANFDLRKRRVRNAIQVVQVGKSVYGTYITETEYIPFVITGGRIIDDEDLERIEHGIGRCPVVQLINKPETGSAHGHSEITEPIISIVNSMMRTMLGAEVAREFYSAPQRYILGADEGMFLDSDGNTRNSLEVLMDRVLILPEGITEGKHPTVGQFASNSPAPYIELMRFYSQLFSSYADIPENYLGFNTVNPTSAEAIKASEIRLIKKAQDRIDGISSQWKEVAIIATLLKNGSLPEGFNPVPQFKDPATISGSAVSDELSKLISAGVLRPDSEIVFRKLGLSKEEIEIVRAENNIANSAAILEALRKDAEANENTAEEVEDENNDGA